MKSSWRNVDTIWENSSIWDLMVPIIVVMYCRTPGQSPRQEKEDGGSIKRPHVSHLENLKEDGKVGRGCLQRRGTATKEDLKLMGGS